MIAHGDIVARIKDILSEHGGEVSVDIFADPVVLEDYITRAISDAVTLLGAKGYRVNVARFTGQEMNLDGLDVPVDYVALLLLKLDTWNVALTEEVAVGSERYRIAMNVYTKPGKNSPVVYRQGDLLVCVPHGEVEYGEYNAVYDGKNLNAEEREAAAVAYMAAALVMGFFEDDNGKQRLSDISTNILQ